MPIYEFYCSECHTIFSFFSKRIDTSSRPGCPKCGKKKLSREVSSFAMGKGGAGEEGDLGDLPIDESKVEEAVMALAGEAEKINEDDPRQAADLMRKFSKMTGLKLGEAMQDALGRMEAGEDPEAVEAEMGKLMEEEEPFVMADKKGEKLSAGERRSRGAPRRDETLYEL